MNLTDLKTYLREHKRASLTDIAYHFNSEPRVIAKMLEHWVRKGKVQHLAQPPISCQKGCCECPVVDIYVWIEAN